MRILSKIFFDILLLTRTQKCILLQRGIANALFATPLPFLGVSSLNLAGPRGRPFFF